MQTQLNALSSLLLHEIVFMHVFISLFMDNDQEEVPEICIFIIKHV
jgi:hypothetical protein